MQLASENINSNKGNQTWTSEEIREILRYVAELQETNENLRAGIIMMQAKLDNEEAKVKRLSLLIATLTNVNSQI
jgi:hypothetical protein